MEKFTREGLESHSEEVQEIINRMPGWIIRFGASMVFIILCGFIWMSWFVKYPDIIKAGVVITTNPPPVTLVSRLAGRIQLLIDENTKVEEGAVVAYVQSPTNLNDLERIETIIKSEGVPAMASLDRDFQLGELQEAYNAFITSVEEQRIFLESDIHDHQISSLKAQWQYYADLSLNLDDQLGLEQKELTLGKQKFLTDSLLFVQRAIARQDYNASQATYLRQQRAFAATQAQIINNRMQARQLEKQVAEIANEKKVRKNELRLAVETRRRTLEAGIKKWKEDHLFLSPVSGRVAYFSFMESGQYVEAGSVLFSVVPDTEQIYGRVELPVEGSGKVKQGQHVNIRLDNYPFEQFGMLSGSVQSISMLPREDVYKVTIELPDGLRSSYGKTLPFHQQLQGQTEIITEDLRLLERIFYQLRKVIRN